jgi:TRAP transporter 4TM/12TM fusion protein
MREFQNKAAIITSILFIAFAGWSLLGAVFPINTYSFRYVHLGFILVLAFLIFPLSKKMDRWTKWVDVVLAGLGLAATVHALANIDLFIRRSTSPDRLDLFFGIVVILLLIELSRRIVGNAFTLILALFLLYGMFGNFLPGPLANKGYDLSRIVGHMYMTLDGIFGVPLSVSVSFIILFVVYGAFMDAAGAGNFWLELSMTLMGRQFSSAGRGVIFTTALLGGPQASDIATTMSVTPIMWPVLKKAGYTADKAAGLIAAGSIGAFISPPLMGATAFLLMQFLDVTYWNVVVMVILPTILFYLGVFFMVELEARKCRFAPPDSTNKTFWQVLSRSGYHLFSLIVLVTLLATGRSAETSVIWAIVAVILTSFLSKDRNEWLTPGRIAAATVNGAKGMLPIATLLAAAGLIVGIFSLTGLGFKISQLIMSLSAGQLLPALGLAALTTLIVGLSMPITPTYIMTVVMVAPALIKIGVPEHVIHLFTFYFAVLSDVSPPIGFSASAAAAITGSNPFAAMMQAWKYTLPAFLVPFLFSATKAGASLLILGAAPWEIILATLNSGFALFFLSLAIVGVFRKPLHIIERVILICIAVSMVIAPIDITVKGLMPVTLGSLVLVRQWFPFLHKKVNLE